MRIALRYIHSRVSCRQGPVLFLILRHDAVARILANGGGGGGRSVLWKLCYHWLKGLRHVAITLVRQGPVLQSCALCHFIHKYPRACISNEANDSNPQQSIFWMNIDCLNFDPIMSTWLWWIIIFSKLLLVLASGLVRLFSVVRDIPCLRKCLVTNQKDHYGNGLNQYVVTCY